MAEHDTQGVAPPTVDAPGPDALADVSVPPIVYKPCFACGGHGCFSIECPTFFVLDPPGAGAAYAWRWGAHATLVTDAYFLESDLVRARCLGADRKGVISKGTFPAKAGRPAGCFLTGRLGERIWYERWWDSLGFTLEYDAGLKLAFDPIIEHMAATFVFGPSRDAGP